MNRIPAWIGWPGTGKPPGHDWLPGRRLRAIILGLVYAFLALALTVDQVYGAAFFLLAILGTYVGLRRGFGNGLTSSEKLIMIAFASYPVIAIFSYLLGTQTNIGFRFIGRDLRMLLFIPIYIGIRWARPKAVHAGWALAAAATGACIMALLQNQPWPAPAPHGVAGTHITFGDLSLLSGFLAAALLFPARESNRIHGTRLSDKAKYIGAFLALAYGLTASVVSGARGGWLAIPVIAVMLMFSINLGRRVTYRGRTIITAIFILGVLGSVFAFSGVRHHMEKAWRDTTTYLTVANARSIDAPCVDTKAFLQKLLDYSHVSGPGFVNVVRLPSEDRKKTAVFSCTGKYALSLGSLANRHSPIQLTLYRGNLSVFSGNQSATIIAKGLGKFSLGWNGLWTHIINPGSWQRYTAKGFYARTAPAIIQVFSANRMFLIPLQNPRGVYAYALAATSIGHRLEMWRAAWALFLKHPWLGSGAGSFHAMAESALGHSATAPIVGNFEHAHNDYLTSLGTKGVAGLLAFIGVLLAPYLALRRQSHNSKSRSPRVAGAILAIGFAIFGMTETILVHSLVISWYVAISALLVGLSMSDEAS